MTWNGSDIFCFLFMITEQQLFYKFYHDHISKPPSHYIIINLDDKMTFNFLLLSLSSSNLFWMLFMFKSLLWCVCLMFDIMHRGCLSELAECIESFRSCETSIVRLRLKPVGRTSRRHFVQVQLLRLSNYSQTRQHTWCVGRGICMFDIARFGGSLQTFSRTL